MTVENGIGIGKSINKKAKFIAGASLLGAAAGVPGFWAHENPDKAANLSRSIIGDDNTARLERVYFSIQDKKDRLVYEITGDKKSPFGKNAEIPNIPSIPKNQIN